MTKSNFFTMSLLTAFVCICLTPSAYATDKEEEAQFAISPKIVADYIHAVIQADRTLYTTHVVERMEDHNIVTAQEYWKQTKSLPLPAQMLLLSGLQVMQQGVGLQFRLASLAPIYERNGPTTDFEKTGLDAVLKDPTQPYTGIIQRGDSRFFKAVYADQAVSSACINCHNGHILSSKRDYKLGDVMGGIIISFPLP